VILLTSPSLPCFTRCGHYQASTSVSAVEKGLRAPGITFYLRFEDDNSDRTVIVSLRTLVHYPGFIDIALNEIASVG
jgi:hypothetical protein